MGGQKHVLPPPLFGLGGGRPPPHFRRLCTHTHTHTHTYKLALATLWEYSFVLSIVKYSQNADRIKTTIVCYCSSTPAKQLLLVHPHKHEKNQTKKAINTIYIVP